MKLIKRDRLIRDRRRSDAEKREARRGYTRRYRSKQSDHGIPDRGTIAEALLQEVLKFAWNAGKKDAQLAEYKAVAAAINRLSRLKKLDGTRQYSDAGIRYRFDVVLCEVLGRKRPEFERTSTSG